MTGEQLRTKRKSLKLTQAELADAIKESLGYGPSVQTIQNIEVGRFKSTSQLTMKPIEDFFSLAEHENAKH